MNNKRTKRLPRIIINQLLVGILMALIALSVIFYAEGYRLNLVNMRVIKTGVLFLSSSPKGASIVLNNKKLNVKTPYATNLTAGNYSTKVEMTGYKTWSANFKINAGLVTEFEQIILFKDNPEISNLSDQRKIDLLNSPVNHLAVNNEKNILIDNGYEIWQNSNLVTRFSKPVQGVIWYPGLNYILYQQGNQIRVIEKTGINDTHLITLSSENSARFTVNNRGDELYFLDNNQYKVAKIR